MEGLMKSIKIRWAGLVAKLITSKFFIGDNIFFTDLSLSLISNKYQVNCLIKLGAPPGWSLPGLSCKFSRSSGFLSRWSTPCPLGAAGMEWIWCKYCVYSHISVVNDTYIERILWLLWSIKGKRLEYKLKYKIQKCANWNNYNRWQGQKRDGSSPDNAN